MMKVVFFIYFFFISLPESIPAFFRAISFGHWGVIGKGNKKIQKKKKNWRKDRVKAMGN